MPRERSRYSDDDDDDHRAKRRKRSDDKKRKHKKQSRRSRSRSYSSRSRSRSRNRSRSRSPKRRISESTNKVTESEKIAERKVEEIVVPQSVPPEPLNVVSAAAQAAARAAEISKLLQSKVPITAMQPEDILRQQRAREIQEQIAAQIASVNSMLSSVRAKQDRKAAYMPLLLDATGRQVDEKGGLVKQSGFVKTLAANVAVGQAKKKKDNPYLAHRQASHSHASAAQSVTSVPTAELGTVVEGAESTVTTVPVTEVGADPRIKTSNRDVRAKKAFQFVEAGSLTKQAEIFRLKEERKIIAGFTSGRRAPEAVEATVVESVDHDTEQGELQTTTAIPTALKSVELVPPPLDDGIVPTMEWWDEVYLPKTTRDNRKRSRAALQVDDFELLNFVNCKTYKYVQHPPPVKPLGGDKPEEPLKLYLTKKERKRIRRTAREERETEKRDKLLMGLIPAPEPKFKLSNFMKLLGDQAVADPSKVEQRVQLQMQQRQLNHEMRNQAKKLTPAERKEKKRDKLLEDTSRQVHVAIFRVADFTDPKHRFKVDVNAQQLNISGTVLLCPIESVNLVVAEGGPKGIRKFISLMMRRVPWDCKVAVSTADKKEALMNGDDVTGAGSDSGALGGGAGVGGGGRDDEDDDDVDDDDDEEGGGSLGDKKMASAHKNKCNLLWQGVVAKRTFHAFRFQECKASTSARKVLEAKGVAHYWDMAVRADEIISSCQDL